MIKVPVLSPDGKPLMPTKPSRARRWIRDGLAVGRWSDLGVFYVQLTQQSSGEETQSIADRDSIFEPDSTESHSKANEGDRGTRL